MTILVTGGTGYIGSHTCVELMEAGHDVVVVDNFSNSHREVAGRVEQITGHPLPVFELDLRNRDALTALFSAHRIDAVIHFAGLKAVGESVAMPLTYFDANIGSTLVLAEVMAEFGVKNLVFSSSATVYGDPDELPIPETAPLKRPTNPYGRSKLFIEESLRDLRVADPDWRVGLLRYFNPVGAHPSGLIGEDPLGMPNNLMPIVAATAVGRRESVSVFGDDYPTADGTGVRDYIHVVDLARAHVAALDYLRNQPRGEELTVNLGTGRGYSVLEVIRAFETASGRPVPCTMAERRPGDVAACYADPGLAHRLLGWRAEFGLDRMCEDVWRWQSQHPDGLQRVQEATSEQPLSAVSA
ncbi:UDP-glucose 4-epimerase [Thiohalospira halophila DSM 15071]|uniref:UDP-glucose 4-epimerase n=1 Tax=Thiohalospira halophila DSM 15071 TaxID=1123397 RepID=A0A1I1P9W0_9GAMM|nr:UDP-glucose 4-epimerase GalE [Thiohalospira halophila]SFD06486.1 UDP-glucose 4-epimerase [Thiohalospira halophila DSM 15071]